MKILKQIEKKFMIIRPLLDQSDPKQVCSCSNRRLRNLDHDFLGHCVLPLNSTPNQHAHPQRACGLPQNVVKQNASNPRCGASDLVQSEHRSQTIRLDLIAFPTSRSSSPRAKLTQFSLRVSANIALDQKMRAVCCSVGCLEHS